MTFLMVMGLGGVIVGIAPATLFWAALVGNVIAGLCNPLVNGPLFAILQARIAPEMQGRVFTLVGSVAGTSSL